MVVRPHRLVLVGRTVAVVLVVVFAVLAYLLPAGSAGGQPFGLGDQIAFFLVGILLAAAVLPFTLVRVEADGSGLRVRNYLSEKSVPWEVVVDVRLDPSAPWAVLDLRDDETVSLLAIQANDGERAVDAVLALRHLLAQTRGG